jgi:hypothetical protein
MVSRRSFLVSAGAGIAASSVIGSAFAAHHEKKIVPGIQLWTVKSEAAKDLEGTLRKVYDAGGASRPGNRRLREHRREDGDKQPQQKRGDEQFNQCEALLHLDGSP